MERLKCIRFQSYNLNISIGKSAGYKCLYRWRMRSSDWSSLSLSNWVDGVGIDLISWIKSGWNHTRIFPLTLIRKIEKSRLEKNFTRYELGQIFNYCLLELSFNPYWLITETKSKNRVITQRFLVIGYESVSGCVILCKQFKWTNVE